jgi:hypothetical protein
MKYSVSVYHFTILSKHFPRMNEVKFRKFYKEWKPIILSSLLDLSTITIFQSGCYMELHLNVR